jgi:hypothetical protein
VAKKRVKKVAIELRIPAFEAQVLREIAELAGEKIETVAGVIICLGIYRHLFGDQSSHIGKGNEQNDKGRGIADLKT